MVKNQTKIIVIFLITLVVLGILLISIIISILLFKQTGSYYNFHCYSDNEFFKTVGELNEARAGHKSFLLNDGKVLIIGGNNQDQENQDDQNQDILNSIELFDPETNKFAIIFKDKRLKVINQFLELGNDKFLVINHLEKAYIYDYKKNSLSEIDFPEGVVSVAKSSDNKLFVYSYAKKPPTFWLYDLDTDKLTKIANITDFEYGYGGFFNLPDGRMCYRNLIDSVCYPYNLVTDSYDEPVELTEDFKYCLSEAGPKDFVVFLDTDEPDDPKFYKYDCKNNRKQKLSDKGKAYCFSNSVFVLAPCEYSESISRYADYAKDTIIYNYKNESYIAINKNKDGDLTSSSIVLKDGRVLFSGGLVDYFDWDQVLKQDENNTLEKLIEAGLFVPDNKK